MNTGDDLEEFVRARPICKALGDRCRRSLYDLIQRGDFPPPDRPAQRRGEPNLWRKSTVQRALANYAVGPKPSAAE